METLKNFTGRLQKFFAFVESHENQIQNLIKETSKPIHSITNQSVFYRAAVPEDSLLNTPFVKFEGFRENLIEIIRASLQEEYNLLDEIRNKINSANEKLHREQISIERAYAQLRSKNLIDEAQLNPCCPSFENIIDWSHDIWRYYHSYYLQISCGLSNLNFTDETTVIGLKKSFREDKKLKSQIERIRSFNFSEFEFII